ncbi:hypothetical protein Tco_0025644 [Tanacetum coccineum]
MANKTVGNGKGSVHSRNNVNHQNQFVPQAVLLRTGKVNIPPARQQPVPAGASGLPAWITAHVGGGVRGGDDFGVMWGVNEVERDRREGGVISLAGNDVEDIQ